MVKIFTKGNKLDFEAPIYMGEEYFKKFCDFLEKLTGEKVEVVPIKEKERYGNPNKEKKHPKRWKAGELSSLLDMTIPLNKLVKNLNRTEMSIKMQRAQFVPEFISWLDKKGSTSDKTNKDLIETFLEETKK